MAVAEKVKSIIVEQLGVDEEEVTPDASFVDDLGADSLDTVELVMAFEEEFGIEIPDEDAEKITRVKEAIEYIESHAKQEVDTVEALSRRVVVTGIGLVSPLGIGTEANWDALCAGQSGIGPITQLRRVGISRRRSPARSRTSIRCSSSRRKTSRRWTSSSSSPIAASQFAMDDSGLRVTPRIAPRVGVFIALGHRRVHAPSSASTRRCSTAARAGSRRSSFPSAIINLAAGQVSIRFGAKGPNSGDVHRLLGVGARHRRCVRDHPARRRRRDDRRRLGGGDHADGRRRLCRDARALDAQRRAGAGEPAVRQGPRRLRHRRGRRASSCSKSSSRAMRRGAKIYAEIVGYGMSGDAYHITAPSEDGDGAVRVMDDGARKARRRARRRSTTSTRTAPRRRTTIASRRWPSRSSSAITPTSWRCRRPSR